jgi:hypothetical protein
VKPRVNWKQKAEEAARGLEEEKCRTAEDIRFAEEAVRRAAELNRQLAAQLPGETRTTLEKLDAVAAAPGATEPERATAARRAAFLRRKAAERGES